MYRCFSVLFCVLFFWGCGQRSNEDLISDLYSEDPRVRFESSLALMQRRGDGDLQERIIELLSDPQDIIVFIATQILGAIGDHEAIKPLGRMIDNPNPHIRARACISLGAIKSISGYPYIERGLNDKDPNVRHAALFAIKHMNYAPALESVFPLMNDSVDSVRVEVVDVLYTYYNSWEHEVAAADLAPSVSDVSPSVRFVAVQALGSGFPDRDVAGALLLEALEDENRFVRQRAIRSLGLIEYQEAVPYLKAMYERVPVDEGAAISEAIRRITGSRFP